MNQCRWAPSLGALEGTHQEAWGTVEYTDRNQPCVFFGLYDVRDYIALFRHKGKAWILWAGSDILNLRNNFYFNNGKLRLLSMLFSRTPKFLVGWLARKAEHWVENENEALMLHSLGIPVTGICPSYMGDKNKFTTTFVPGNNVYISASEGRQAEYGFGLIDTLAPLLPELNFHLYGASWKSRDKNVIVHGRVSKEQMNKETAGMQVSLRINEFDGFSEITAKAILRGQYPMTRIYYPHIPSFDSASHLFQILPNWCSKKKPNEYEKYYRQKINEYPWTK